MSCPDSVYAGDSLEFPVDVADFPPVDGWTLKYRLTARFSSPVQAAIVMTATVVDGQYVVGATAEQTAAWAAGTYYWARWVERGTAGVDFERQTLDDLESRGELKVLQNPATSAQGFDGRSQAKKALDDALSALAGWGPTRKSFTVGDKAVVFNSVREIKDVIAFWQSRVEAEDATAAGRSTGPLGRMRFGVPNP